jgi:arginine repressor
MQSTLNPTDLPKFASQRAAIEWVLSDGKPRTLTEIREDLKAAGVLAMETGISARWREIKLPKESSPGKNGQWLYRLIPQEPKLIQTEMF